MRSTNWTRAKAAPAIWAHTMQNCLRAGHAERALEAAYHSFGRVRRQVFVAAFAVWTNLQHCHLQFGLYQCLNQTHPSRAWARKAGIRILQCILGLLLIAAKLESTTRCGGAVGPFANRDQEHVDRFRCAAKLGTQNDGRPGRVSAPIHIYGCVKHEVWNPLTRLVAQILLSGHHVAHGTRSKRWQLPVGNFGSDGILYFIPGQPA